VRKGVLRVGGGRLSSSSSTNSDKKVICGGGRGGKWKRKEGTKYNLSTWKGGQVRSAGINEVLLKGGTSSRKKEGFARSQMIRKKGFW